MPYLVPNLPNMLAIHKTMMPNNPLLQIDQKVIVRAAQIVKQHKKFRNLANSDWVEAQQRDLVVPHVIAWINRPKDDRRGLTEYLDGSGALISDYNKHFYVAH